MLDGSLFDTVEYVARKVRETEAPFGGMQVSDLYSSICSTKYGSLNCIFLCSLCYVETSINYRPYLTDMTA